MQVCFSLFWKEWLELRWKVAALGAIPVALLMAILLFVPDSVPFTLAFALGAYTTVATLFLAMSVSTAEQVDGTLEFVRGLPIARWQLGLVRVTATLIALLAPIVMTALLANLVYGLLVYWDVEIATFRLHPTTTSLQEIWSTTLIAASTAVSLFLWMIALAMNHASQLRAGMVCVAVAIGWGIVTMWGVAVWDNHVGLHNLIYINSIGPYASLIRLDPGLTSAMQRWMLAFHVLTLPVLVYWAVSQYGRLERPDPTKRSWPRLVIAVRNRFKSSGNIPTVTPGFRSTTTALAWLQCRQAVPIALVGMLFMLFWAFFSAEGAVWTREFRREVSYSAALVGNLWAVVIATGLFADDLESRLHTFWRSRPIRPTTWFWGKYLIGAGSILAFIDLPAVALGVYDPHLFRMLPTFLCVTVQHCASFSIAVMSICFIRHTVYAGVFGTCGMLIVAGYLPWLDYFHLRPLMHEFEYFANNRALSALLLMLVTYIVLMAAISLVAAFISRWAIQRDIAIEL